MPVWSSTFEKPPFFTKQEASDFITNMPKKYENYFAEQTLLMVSDPEFQALSEEKQKWASISLLYRLYCFHIWEKEVTGSN